MTEETQVPTAPETQNPAPEPVQQPELTEQDSTAPEGEGDEPASDADKPEKTPEQKELERLRRQLMKAQRVNGRLSVEAQQARQELQRYAPQQQEAQLDLSQIDEGTFKQIVQSEAKKLAAQELETQDVQRKTASTVEAGTRAFGKAAFDAATAAFVEEVGGVQDERGNMNPVVRAVLRLDDAHAVIKFLGDNPEIAAELPGLDKFELGLKLAEVRNRTATKPPPKSVSKAPDPAKPIGATRGPRALSDLSMDEYIQQRKAQGARWAR